MIDSVQNKTGLRILIVALLKTMYPRSYPLMIGSELMPSVRTIDDKQFGFIPSEDGRTYELIPGTELPKEFVLDFNKCYHLYKNEVRALANDLGYRSRYSGHLRRFFFRRYDHEV